MRAAEREIAKLVIAMFLRFPSSANAADQGERDRLYVAELRQFPQWAIEAAAAKVSGAFAPSLPDLVAKVRDELASVHTELSGVCRLLAADVYHVPTEEERARVEAGYRDMLDKLEWSKEDMRPAKQRPPTRQEALQAVDDMRAQPVELPPFSPALRAVLGLREAAE